MRFVLLIILLLLPLPLPAEQETPEQETPEQETPVQETPLYVALWAEYLPGWVWQQFYDETQIKVIPRFYAQRLPGYQQALASMPYNDLVFSCLEHAQHLEQQGKLRAIDYQRLANRRNLQLYELPDEFQQKFSHCLPFAWHLLGLVVNSQQVDPARLRAFAALWDTDIAPHVYLPEEPRVLASLALRSLGASSNSTQLEHIKLAREKVEQLLPLLDGVSNYGMLGAMARGSTGVGLTWSGISTDLNLAALPQMKFILPEGGGLLLVEGWVIPQQAVNLDGAYAFLDFLMRPDVAGRIASECGYPSINNKVRLPEAIKDNPLYNPPLNRVREAELESYVPQISEQFSGLLRPRD